MFIGSTEDPKLIFAFLSGFVAALILLALMGRAPGFILPLLRILGRPLHVFRKLIPRTSVLRRVRSRGRATSQAAGEGAIVIDRGIGLTTEVERSLHIADDGPDGTPGAVPHSFREEEAILQRSGWWFKSIRIPAEYLPFHLLGPLTDEISNQYVTHAKKFFSAQVALSANSNSLYEDAEGAFIVSLFRSIDRRCYYVLNEMRKTINDNARHMIVLFSLMLFAWSGTAIWAYCDAVAASPGGAMAVISRPMLIAFPLWAASVVAMLMIQAYGYRQQQRHNSRELRFFLTKYLGRIADRYREATGNAKQVTVGDETDSHSLSRAAQKWHKIMVWIPFRTFFIECYVRNIRYQINRNCGYYLWIPPVSVFVLALVILYFVVYGAPPASSATLHSTSFALTAMSLAVMLGIFLFVYFDRIHSVVLSEELSRLDWLGYENLNVSSAMDEVVGKYAEEVGFWKERFKL
jgi:hypothetical protein